MCAFVYVSVCECRILYRGGFTKVEQLEFKAVIYGNILQSALAIVAGMEKLQINFDTETAAVSTVHTYTYTEKNTFTLYFPFDCVYMCVSGRQY